jgi:hypothetical protein
MESIWSSNIPTNKVMNRKSFKKQEDDEDDQEAIIKNDREIHLIVPTTCKDNIKLDTMKLTEM